MFFQLKAIRKNSKPPVWRRIVVPSNITFAQLAVILEGVLETRYLDRYEFEFFTPKIRLIEWTEEKASLSDFYYSYLNGPDTFINQWMMKEKAFSFRMLGVDKSLPEYRIEIEKILDDIKINDGKSRDKINFPVITKQVSAREDAYWSDPIRVNERMEKSYFVEYGEAEYPYSEEILKQIGLGKGITACEKMVDRNIHTKKSSNTQLQELGKALNTSLTNGRGNQQEHKPKEKVSSKKRECKMEMFLRSYDKDDLLELAEEMGVTCSAKRKDKLAYEIARCLLDASTMKSRLLLLGEKGLDAFEMVIDRGAFVPTEREWEVLRPVYDLDYLSTFSDHSVQVPDEVIHVYQAIKKNGYREYHRKASWLLKCIRAACFIYMSEPLDVLYQLYIRNKAVQTDYEAFCNLLKTIPENMSNCILVGQKLVYKDIYVTGVYKQLEKVRRGGFYIPNKQEIEILCRDKYPSHEAAYKSLLQFFQKEMRYPENYSIYLCQIACQVFSGGGLLSDYMNILNQIEVEFGSKKMVKRFADIMMRVNNETRMAELMGHKPAEVMGTVHTR